MRRTAAEFTPRPGAASVVSGLSSACSCASSKRPELRHQSWRRSGVLPPDPGSSGRNSSAARARAACSPPGSTPGAGSAGSAVIRRPTCAWTSRSSRGGDRPGRLRRQGLRRECGTSRRRRADDFQAQRAARVEHAHGELLPGGHREAHLGDRPETAAVHQHLAVCAHIEDADRQLVARLQGDSGQPGLASEGDAQERGDIHGLPAIVDARFRIPPASLQAFSQWSSSGSNTSTASRWNSSSRAVSLGWKSRT